MILELFSCNKYSPFSSNMSFVTTALGVGVGVGVALGVGVGLTVPPVGVGVGVPCEFGTILILLNSIPI